MDNNLTRSSKDSYLGATLKPSKHGATGSKADRNRHLNWTRSSLPEAKRNHLAHGNYTGPEAFCQDLMFFHNKNGSGSALIKQHWNSSEKKTEPGRLRPSSRKFKSDHFRKNIRGPVVVDQNRAGNGETKLWEYTGGLRPNRAYRASIENTDSDHHWINQNWTCCIIPEPCQSLTCFHKIVMQSYERLVSSSLIKVTSANRKAKQFAICRC